MDIPHLYIDMDGVLSDLHGYLGIDIEANSVQQYREKIADYLNSPDDKIYTLFRTLPKLTGGVLLTEWIRENNLKFTILSAPIKGLENTRCIDAKIDWLDEHLPGASVSAIFDREKFKYAVYNSVPNVLVDDLSKNISAWQAQGGIGILHSDADCQGTLDKLIGIYKK